MNTNARCLQDEQKASRSQNGSGSRKDFGWKISIFVIGWILLAPFMSWSSTAAEDDRLKPPADKATEVVSADTVWSVDRARTGDRIVLALVMQIQKGFHINADAAQLLPNPEFSPYPTRVRVLEASPDITVEKLRFPSAHEIEVDFVKGPLRVFDGEVVVYLPITIQTGFSEDTLRIRAALSYQACDEKVCLVPQTMELATLLPVAAEGETPRAMFPEIFRDRASWKSTERDTVGFSLFSWNYSLDLASSAGFWLLLLTAALGGLLLNFTPCVLPLIPIKIMGLSNAARDRLQCLMMGFATFFGVLAFWLLLGTAIAVFSGFTATNQLFQYPVFTILVGLIIAVMAVGMCGLFSIPLPQFFYRFNPKEGTLFGCFGIGTLSAILSTPCTAPFMGAAAAWAATQRPALTITVFSAIGTGMALPYLVLSAAPGMVQRMPRSGPAGILIKQVMGLFMLAAAAYFLGTGLSGLAVAPPDPPSTAYWWAVMGFTAAGGIWTAYRTLKISTHTISKGVFVVLGVLVFSASVYGGLRLTDKGPVEWTYYTEERFEKAQEEGKVVVMVFTAEWCLNCKALEQGVLRTDAVADLLRQDHVAPFKVDITGNNPAGKERLRNTGHLTIPLLVVYAPDGREIFKNDFYTSAEILEAVAKATSGS